MRSIHGRAGALPVLVAASLMALPVAAQSGDDAGPWLGVALPGGLALPPQLEVLYDPGFAAEPASVPTSEAAHTELRGESIQPLLREIVDFSLESRASGRLMWGRVSGFPAAARTAAWVADQYRAAGLERVEVQPYEADGPMWWPEQWEVRLLGTDALGRESDDVILRSAVPARGAQVPDGTLTAPLVYVGEVDDHRDVDVRDKVAIQRIRPAGESPSGQTYGAGAFALRSVVSAGAEALFERGALAVLNWVDQPGNMHVRDFGCPACFNLGGADGTFVSTIADRASAAGRAEDLRVRLHLDASEREGRSAQNVIGVVPGESEEVVIVNAHLDGWYDAAGDNGDGLAVQIALARHFAHAADRPARTLVFVSSGGHHSAGLNGPQRFISANRGLAERAVLVLNLEHIAQYEVEPATFEVLRTEQDMGWGITNLAPYLVELTDTGRERYGFQLRDEYGTGVPGDLGRYAPLGIPRVQAIHAGPLYHTSGDVFESISVEGLERAARFYAYFISGVAEATREQIDP